MRAWLWYAAAAVALLAGAAWVLGVLLEPGAAPGAWVAAAVALPVQLVAFGLLVWGRRRGRNFMVMWAAGMLLRFVVIAGVALVVTRIGWLDPAVSLVSLVGFVFVLVLLEPLFLRLTD